MGKGIAGPVSRRARAPPWGGPRGGARGARRLRMGYGPSGEDGRGVLYLKAPVFRAELQNGQNGRYLRVKLIDEDAGEFIMLFINERHISGGELPSAEALREATIDGLVTLAAPRDGKSTLNIQRGTTIGIRNARGEILSRFSHGGNGGGAVHAEDMPF
jgi:hypothetical protein